MNQATEVYSAEFDSIFFRLPGRHRQRVEEKIRFLGAHLQTFAHERLHGRPELRLRVGDYRVIYRFDRELNYLYLVTLGHRRDVYKM